MDWMAPFIHSMKLSEVSAFYVYGTLYSQRIREFLDEYEHQHQMPLDGKPKVLLFAIKWH